MNAKELAVRAMLLSTAFGAGAASHLAATLPGRVSVHHIELTARPQPDGGLELEEIAFGKRDGRHTGPSSSCAAATCVQCFNAAQASCEWPAP